MNFSYRLPAVLIGGAIMLLGQLQLAVALTPREVSDKAKEFTVAINGDVAGTGVIFEQKGHTYYVITNRHLVPKEGKYEVKTFDGKEYPVNRSQELPGLDLAVLQFTSDKNYRLANLGNSDKIKEGMTVYVVGWAEGLEGLPGINPQNYYFTEGRINSRLTKPDDGYALVYNNPALPGMSGGPVLDENASVVGINGRAEELAKQGTSLGVLRLGIPIKTFLAARNRPTTESPATTQQPGASQNLTTTASKTSSAEEFISLGGAKAKKQDYEGAIADYNQALQISPEDPDHYFRRGVAFRQKEDYQEALRDFNQVIHLSPKNTSAYLNRGLVRISLKDYQGAKADGDKAISLDPTLSDGYFIRGDAKYHLKDYEGANADYDQVIHLSTATKDVAKVYAFRSEIRNQRGDYEGAKADGDQVIGLNPKYAGGYLIRGLAKYKLKDYQGAIADFDKGISLNPKNRTFYALRGKIRNQQGDYEGAKADGDKIVRLAPKFSTGYLIRGLARHKLKEYQGAIGDFEQVISLGLAPTNVTIAEALRGNNEEPLSNNQVSKDFKAAQSIPNNANTDVIQGFTSNHLQEDYSVTFPSSEKALALDANPLVAVMHLGLIKYELQDALGAIREFQAAIHINSKDPEPQLALAVALYGQGKQQRGLAMAADALRLQNQLADLKYLKESLWGALLLADTQKVLSDPKIQTLTSSPSGGK